MDAVSSLPEDGVPEELLTVEEQDDPDDPPAMPNSSVVDQIMTEIDEWHFSQDSPASGDQQQQQQQQQQQLNSTTSSKANGYGSVITCTMVGGKPAVLTL